MTEYIDRDAAIEAAKHAWAKGLEPSQYMEIISAVDVAPVRHGRWRCHGDCGVTECSVCGWSIEEYVGDYAYCPNCGAKMHEEVSE